MLSKKETGIKIEPQVSANRPSKNWAQYCAFLPVLSLLLEIFFPMEGMIIFQTGHGIPCKRGCEFYHRIVNSGVKNFVMFSNIFVLFIPKPLSKVFSY